MPSHFRPLVLAISLAAILVALAKPASGDEFDTKSAWMPEVEELYRPDVHYSQAAATQALAMFNNMVRLGLSPNQMFTMGMGSNRPRHAGGVQGNPNRRVEIVIYPETFDGA